MGVDSGSCGPWGESRWSDRVGGGRSCPCVAVPCENRGLLRTDRARRHEWGTSRAPLSDAGAETLYPVCATRSRVPTSIHTPTNPGVCSRAPQPSSHEAAISSARAARGAAHVHRRTCCEHHGHATHHATAALPLPVGRHGVSSQDAPVRLRPRRERQETPWVLGGYVCARVRGRLPCRAQPLSLARLRQSRRLLSAPRGSRRWWSGGGATPTGGRPFL